MTGDTSLSSNLKDILEKNRQFKKKGGNYPTKNGQRFPREPIGRKRDPAQRQGLEGEGNYKGKRRKL